MSTNKTLAKTEYDNFLDNDTLSIYMRDLNGKPPLSREEEDETAREAASGNTDARNKLVSANLRFVVNIAKRYRGKGLALPDLIAEGNYGLLMAAERFDPGKGYRFITYAVWWIKQAILKAIYDKSRAIRLPVNRVAELSKIERICKEVDYRLGIKDKVKQIALELGMEEDDVQMLLKVSRDIVSLDSPLYNDDVDSSPAAEGIGDEMSRSPYEDAAERVMKSEVENALTSLSASEVRVLRYRYGIGENTKMSFRELGGFLGLTKERVRQIEKTALKRLASSEKLKAWLDVLPEAR